MLPRRRRLGVRTPLPLQGSLALRLNSIRALCETAAAHLLDETPSPPAATGRAGSIASGSVAGGAVGAAAGMGGAARGAAEEGSGGEEHASSVRWFTLRPRSKRREALQAEEQQSLEEGGGT